MKKISSEMYEELDEILDNCVKNWVSLETIADIEKKGSEAYEKIFTRIPFKQEIYNGIGRLVRPDREKIR